MQAQLIIGRIRLQHMALQAFGVNIQTYGIPRPERFARSDKIVVLAGRKRPGEN